MPSRRVAVWVCCTVQRLGIRWHRLTGHPSTKRSNWLWQCHRIRVRGRTVRAAPSSCRSTPCPSSAGLAMRYSGSLHKLVRRDSTKLSPNSVKIILVLSDVWKGGNICHQPPQAPAATFGRCNISPKHSNLSIPLHPPSELGCRSWRIVGFIQSSLPSVTLCRVVSTIFSPTINKTFLR